MSHALVKALKFNLLKKIPPPKLKTKANKQTNKQKTKQTNKQNN
jgi:hypothetical protein